MSNGGSRTQYSKREKDARLKTGTRMETRGKNDEQREVDVYEDLSVTRKRLEAQDKAKHEKDLENIAASSGGAITSKIGRNVANQKRIATRRRGGTNGGVTKTIKRTLG